MKIMKQHQVGGTNSTEGRSRARVAGTDFFPATCGGERTSQEIGLNGLGGSPADFIESPMKGSAVRAAKRDERRGLSRKLTNKTGHLGLSGMKLMLDMSWRWDHFGGDRTWTKQTRPWL